MKKSERPSFLAVTSALHFTDLLQAPPSRIGMDPDWRSSPGDVPQDQDGFRFAGLAKISL